MSGVDPTVTLEEMNKIKRKFDKLEKKIKKLNASAEGTSNGQQNLAFEMVIIIYWI